MKQSATLQKHLLGSGTASCAGCGALDDVKLFYDILGKKTVFVNAAGCMTLLTIYPYTPFRGSWIYTAMASAPAGAQGIRDALDILLKKGRIPPEEDLQVVVLTGDGSAYGMGLSSTSGAMERGLDFIYICYDNEGYGNTGHQFSAATPHGAHTATSQGLAGYSGYKKDLFSIWAAHQPAYLATVSSAYPQDMAEKIRRAKEIKGPRMFIGLAPCPTGWHFDPSETVAIGKLAVRTGIWPLKEYINGRVHHTHIPHAKKPLVDEYLKRQGRFRSLFSPQRNSRVIDEIQAGVDSYWQDISHET
ncbi:MAG: pyruvate synthase [Proteobacteria bacterium]|nr:pyruvate synthase [Pseudomonadota bacterium]MBU1418734.1 pyruvate synthase [Pseudomonadota bacterium]MBU1455959.1 pyruvate synthase [Pseudomonadota bacterium]